MELIQRRKKIRIIYEKLPKATQRVGNIPVGQIVRDLVIKADPKPTIYRKYANCEVKKKDHIFTTFIWSMNNRYIIVHQIATIISDIMIPDGEVLMIYDLKTGAGINVVVNYQFRRDGNIRASFSLGVDKGNKPIQMPYPTNENCKSLFVNKFVPIIRMRRIKNVALRGL